MVEKQTSRFHESNYRVLSGNASLSDARVIVIGETHRDRHVRRGAFGIKRFHWTWSQNRIHVRELIAAKAQEGDMLLRESYRRGRKYSWGKSHEEFHTPRGVITLGWDNMFWNRISKFWQWKSRRAFVKGDEEKENYYTHKMYYSARKRNRSLAKSISKTERKLQKGSRLFVVAGEWHVKNNHELQESLRDKSHIVVVASTGGHRLFDE